MALMNNIYTGSFASTAMAAQTAAAAQYSAYYQQQYMQYSSRSLPPYVEKQLHELGYDTQTAYHRDEIDVRDRRTGKVCALDMDMFYSQKYMRYDDHADMIRYVIDTFEHTVKNTKDYRHPGPTTAQLADPRIKEAYEAMQILTKLIGV